MVRRTFHTKTVGFLNKGYFGLTIWNSPWQIATSLLFLSLSLTSASVFLEYISRKPRETVDWLSGLEVRVAVKRAMGQQGPPCLVWERGKEKCVTCHRLHNTYIYCERQVCRSYDLPTAFYILWAVLTLEGVVARWKHVFYACQHWRMNALLDHRAKKKLPPGEVLIRPSRHGYRLHLCWLHI